MEKELNKTIRAEIAVATKIASSILLTMSSDNETSVKNASHILDMAVSMVKMCISKAEDTVSEQTARGSKRKGERATVTPQKAIDEEKVRAAAEGLDKTFGAVVSLERFLAKQEGREMNMRHLTKMARRMTKAFFKNVEGVDTSHIDINFSGKEANITIPKYQNDEEQ